LIRRRHRNSWRSSAISSIKASASCCRRIARAGAKRLRPRRCSATAISRGHGAELGRQVLGADFTLSRSGRAEARRAACRRSSVRGVQQTVKPLPPHHRSRRAPGAAAAAVAAGGSCSASR
jgi:hypothetical protein